MSASKKQIELIEELQSRGAAIPSSDTGNPDDSMFLSIAAADAYIKQWGHLMRKHSTKMRPGELGDIPNV